MSASAEARPTFNYFFGLLNFVAVFCVVWLLWYVFMNPNAVMRLYTPMYGFSLAVAFLAAIVLIHHIAEDYPFGEPAAGDSMLLRGILLTVIALGLMFFLVFGVFWGFLGRFGIAYFSPDSIIVTGGVGAEFFVARENACTAIVYFLTGFLWMSLFWSTGFGKWPWGEAGRGVRAWSKFFAVGFLTVIIYSVLFHPHVCYLFYPAQTKAGVEPWWAAWTETGSAFVCLGLVLCTLFWIVASDALWEGYPWKLLERNGEGTFLKGLLTFVVTVALGFVLMYVLLQVMTSFWDAPFMGGQYTDGPDFRFIHAGEIAGFLVLATFMLKTYFNNFPNVGGIWARCIARTVIAAAGAGALYGFYYSPLATFFLAKVPGVAQPGDTPLVWTIIFLSVIMIQADFMKGWPLRKV
ncbi:MAG: hypothetical protein WAK57_06440 [Desulfobacterales bacterium]